MTNLLPLLSRHVYKIYIYIDIKEAKNLKKIKIQGELKGSDSDPAEETFSGSNDNMVSGALGNWSPLKKS